MSISLYNMQQFGGPDAAHSWGARRGSDGEDFLFLRQGGSGDRRVPAVSVFDQQIGRGQSNGLPFAAAGANRADAAGKKWPKRSNGKSPAKSISGCVRYSRVGERPAASTLGARSARRSRGVPRIADENPARPLPRRAAAP